MFRKSKVRKEARKEPPALRVPVFDAVDHERFEKLVGSVSWDKVQLVDDCDDPDAGFKRLPFVSKHLHEMADLFAERNAVYKDNFRMVGRIMQAMFPDGVELSSEEDHNKFHLFMLAIVKLSRYAINYDQGHKDSLDDMIVYLSMVAALDDESAQAKEAKKAPKA